MEYLIGIKVYRDKKGGRGDKGCARSVRLGWSVKVSLRK